MKKIKKFLKILGPGFITGASDDDPSGIGTYSQTGAQFGYGQLWTALFSIPFMTVVQEMSGRIGLLTGQGLAGVIKEYYPRYILYFAVSLLLVANIVNIGADLGAMAASAQMLLGIPFIFWLIGMVVLSLSLEIFITYKTYARYLKYLTLSLFGYIITVLVIKQDWSKILLSTFIPSLSFTKDYLMNIVGVLGTKISPYLFFWQADEEVEEEIEERKIKASGQGTPKINQQDIQKMRTDTVIGMVFSNLIMFFIIATTATTLHNHGITSIETAPQAAEALRPLVGNLAFLLFTIGIVGTGLLAVPVLSGSASYAVAETLGWKAGLYRKLKQAHGFYGVITIATLVGLLINFTPIKPFTLLYYTAILNGLCAPPLLVLMMLITNNKKIMGKNTNSSFSNIMGWVITLIMTASAIGLLWSLR